MVEACSTLLCHSQRAQRDQVADPCACSVLACGCWGGPCSCTRLGSDYLPVLTLLWGAWPTLLGDMSPTLLVGAASRHDPQPHHLPCCSSPGCSYNAAFTFFDYSLASSIVRPHLLDFVSSPQIHGPSVAALPFSLSGWEIHDNMFACLARNSAARARRAARWRPIIPMGSRLPSCLKIVLLVGGHVPQLCYASCFQGA